MAAQSRKTPNPQIELRCRIDHAMLSPLREFICNVCRQLGFSEAQVAEIEICVDEACANAMEHAYPKSMECEFPGDEQNLHIEICYGDGELTLRVTDFGCGCEEEARKRVKELEDYIESDRDRFRGLGLFMINKFMDTVSVSSRPGHGTMVEMTKKRA